MAYTLRIGPCSTNYVHYVPTFLKVFKFTIDNLISKASTYPFRMDLDIDRSIYFLCSLLLNLF